MLLTSLKHKKQLTVFFEQNGRFRLRKSNRLTKSIAGCKKKSTTSARAGFTLVEMLIVIVIIMILAMIALGNFGDARKKAQVDLAADSVISGFKQQQGKARSGRVVESGGSSVGGGAGGLVGTGLRCYGLVLSVDELVSVKADGGQGGEGESSKFVQYIETPYFKVKPGENKADFCDLGGVGVVKRPFDGDPDLKIVEILKGAGEGTGAQQVVVLFKPPFGKVVYYDSLIAIEPSSPMDDLKVGVTMENISVDEDEVDDYIKYLFFKHATGGTSRIYD